MPQEWRAVGVTWGAASAEELAATGPATIASTVDELRRLLGV